MRYDLRLFDTAVSKYKASFAGTDIKRVYICGPFNRKAFFSLPPLSRALDELGIDLNVSFGYKNRNYEIVFDVWDAYEEIGNQKSRKGLYLREFLSSVDIKGFKRYFRRPGLVIRARKNTFSGQLPYLAGWHKDVERKRLRQTTDAIIKNVYALKDEAFSIGFVLVPKADFLSHPLQDYLDSYLICYSMFLSSKNIASSISIKSSTMREGMRDSPEMTSELMTTLLGLELEKDISQPVFEKYRFLSRSLGLDRIRVAPATFFISGKGYPGKHIFGEKVGYPTNNQKTKWTSPGGIVYKFPWYPQSEQEERPPRSRVAFTSTVPIERLIESANIDYRKMRQRNRQISQILERCDKVLVKSKHGCDFEVGLMKKGVHRRIMGSDSDVRTLFSQDLYKKTGKKFGRMANIPGGESFTTPAYVAGRIVGDVVINIDRSYVLSRQNPIIIESSKQGYIVKGGPKDIIKKLNQKKREAWRNIHEQEKNNSVSQDIIKLKKFNFNKIGEFAINTNPNARLCDYLIINEKIANMIHVALGSGFEADAATEYHMDIVIDSPWQKLDIYGMEKGKRHWIIRQGAFVI